MNYERILISSGLSSLFITIINFCKTESFEFGGVTLAFILIAAGFYKINKSQTKGVSLGYIVGYLFATSTNSIVLGMVLATFSSPFLIAESVTVALNEVMTFHHWLCFIIGVILIIKGLVSSKKNN
tara:strand:+ start:236 stop:613 length:378 start_codon:yes stop_codon:yes gene_type:complete